ncbi:phosphate transport system substrate-binding protein [Yoonia maricola]|uniref:Phosphate transport system substrate-binding protein n=1 Tax=Yoonia maricola TaxID=420999 RepID=A0A2M8WL50_9RHOB|nr:phosphate ABC transporter substrate-binding/OmpA family protein [Yoonia maricola]PJI91639.1 phosphate transport system substrate-binding protein [Yoonia maricola]
MTLRIGRIKSNTTSMIALLGITFVPALATAGEVTLKSSDGTVNITGEFIEFTDNNYIIETPSGPVRVTGRQVNCEGASCPEFTLTDVDIRLAGADVLAQGLAPLLLEGFAGAREAKATATVVSGSGESVFAVVDEDGFGAELANYLVSPTSSGGAFQSLASKSIDIGMSTRRISPSEAEELGQTGAGDMFDPAQEHIVALDSLVMIVHPDNPVSELSYQQLGGIYGGFIKNWAEVGGNDAPITLVERDAGAGTRTELASTLAGRILDQVPPIQPGAVVGANNGTISQIVSNDPNAIGYVGNFFVRGNKGLALINECGRRQTPDAFSVRTEEYALHRFLYLYTRADVTAQPLADLIDYAVSDEAGAVISKAGFIDLGIDRRQQSLDSERAKILVDRDIEEYDAENSLAMLSELENYDRLSATFRFETGSRQLTPRGLLNIEVLTEYLEDQPEGTKVKLVGFADSVGNIANNTVLSRGRAERVLETLQDFAEDRLSGIELTATGYGEAAPVGCNISDNGRRLNRRVEVWIEN